MSLSRSSKDYIRKALVASQLLDFATRFAVRAAVILMYHSVREDEQDLTNIIGPGITHTSAIFAHQMEIIAREFTPVSLDDIVCYLAGGAGLPRRAVAVTFDDGFSDNQEVAAPILEHFGIRASFYATADLIGTSRVPWYSRIRYAFSTTKRKQWSHHPGEKTWDLQDLAGREAAMAFGFEICAPMVGEGQERAVRKIEVALESQVPTCRSELMMSWEQLRKLHASGHIVGSHTLTHPNLAHVSDDESLRRELFESKERIEHQLGSPVAHFSYPHPALDPQWSQRTMTMTASAGYKSAVTTNRGRVTAHANPLCLKRVGVPRSEEQFRWNLGRAFIGQRPGY